MKVAYIVSALLDFSKMISTDGGPGFANDYRWPVHYISEINSIDCDFLIFDPWFSEHEANIIKESIRFTNKKCPIKLVDSNWENSSFSPMYRLAVEMLDQPRIHYLLTYRENEFTSLLASRARRSQFVFAPYIYQPDREEDIVNTWRTKKCCFPEQSGKFYIR